MNQNPSQTCCELQVVGVDAMQQAPSGFEDTPPPALQAQTGADRVVAAGGDAFISICLWQAGYAVTDPGFSFYHPEVQMFDPGPEDRMGVMLKLVRALDSNRCDSRCKVGSVCDHAGGRKAGAGMSLAGFGVCREKTHLVD